MNYLTPEAAERYYQLSVSTYERGLISLTPMLVRLHALRSMCAQGEPICKVLKELLEPHDFTVDDEWRDDGEISREVSGVRSEKRESLIESQIDTSEHLILKFTADTSTNLSNWVFHQADPDFFPSIPHGHLSGKAQPKLDAYLGWIYKGAKQTAREPKENIIALWNDKKFRAFAGAAIDYYTTTFPNHQWRVATPWRLPRRR
jgi:hypothetical protein